MNAYHFVGDKLRDGSPIPRDGVWLEFVGHPVLCEQGLHASRCPFDALQYAPRPILCMVELGGTIVEGGDKLVATRRKIISRVDFTTSLRYFARMEAISVVHLWDAPQLVLDFLMTGNESLRAAAWATARDAAWAAAGDAARDAAWATARAAAGDAAWATAWAAARATARATAGATARAAAGDAAWAASRQRFIELVNEAFQ
jgi:hypothetical protein